MHLKWTLTFLLLFSFSYQQAQITTGVENDSDSQPRFMVSLGCTPFTEETSPSLSVELGYSVSPKTQVFVGPKYYVPDYDFERRTSNTPTGQVFGASIGARRWWKGVPQTGWAYFTSLEAQTSVTQLFYYFGTPIDPNDPIHLKKTFDLHGLEIGNGLGRFSDSGFFFLFHVNVGAHLELRQPYGGGVYAALRLATGIRF